MKTLTTLCLSLLFAATTFAQTEPGTFSLLPKVGLNLSNLTKSTIELDMKAGFCGGFELNYQLNKSFSLTLGALYSQHGESRIPQRSCTLQFPHYERFSCEGWRATWPFVERQNTYRTQRRIRRYEPQRLC